MIKRIGTILDFAPSQLTDLSSIQAIAINPVVWIVLRLLRNQLILDDRLNRRSIF